LGNVFPQGIIFAPTISTHLKRLNLNKNGHLIGVEYSDGLENTYIVTPPDKIMPLLRKGFGIFLEEYVEEVGLFPYRLEKLLKDNLLKLNY
ncbi:hypothetical protein GOV03_03390, partial [Candidatus Woesearchaeota archaeon]|nr:hypothetical protein [Candidatus Woesearchaeota archaeon]